jgi:hypothetical protein
MATTKTAKTKTGTTARRKFPRRTVWDDGEVRTLRSLAKKRTPVSKIAKTLKRSEGATRQKAFAIGLSLDTRAA